MTASNELLVVHLEEWVGGGEKLRVEHNLEREKKREGGRERGRERERWKGERGERRGEGRKRKESQLNYRMGHLALKTTM